MSCFLCAMFGQNFESVYWSFLHNLHLLPITNYNLHKFTLYLLARLFRVKTRRLQRNVSWIDTDTDTLAELLKNVFYEKYDKIHLPTYIC